MPTQALFWYLYLAAPTTNDYCDTAVLNAADSQFPYRRRISEIRDVRSPVILAGRISLLSRMQRLASFPAFELSNAAHAVLKRKRVYSTMKNILCRSFRLSDWLFYFSSDSYLYFTRRCHAGRPHSTPFAHVSVAIRRFRRIAQMS